MKKSVFIAAFLAVVVLILCGVGYYVSDRSTTELSPTARPTAKPALRILEPEPTGAESETDRLLREIEDFTGPTPQWFTPDPRAVAAEYVLNKNTHVFHSPKCRYVSSIDAANAETVWQTRDELIAAGYEPCGVCNP